MYFILDNFFMGVKGKFRVYICFISEQRSLQLNSIYDKYEHNVHFAVFNLRIKNVILLDTMRLIYS